MAKYKKAKKVGTKQEVSKRTIIIMALLITMGLAVFLGTSYAIFTLTLRGSKQVSIQVGTFQVDFENSQFIRLNNVTGMSEEEGLQTTPYRFTITNSGDIKAYYNISLTDESAIGETTKLNTAYLHYNLIGPNGLNQSGIVGNTNGGLVSNQSLEPGVSDDYELRLWLDENTPNSEMGTTYQSKIAVESSQVESPTYNITYHYQLNFPVYGFSELYRRELASDFYGVTNQNPTTYKSGDMTVLIEPELSGNKICDDFSQTINPSSATASFDFSGWYLDEWYETAITSLEGQTGDLTLYARWISTTCFDVSGSSSGGN